MSNGEFLCRICGSLVVLCAPLACIAFGAYAGTITLGAGCAIALLWRTA